MNPQPRVDPLFLFLCCFALIMILFSMSAEIARRTTHEELSRFQLREGRRWANRIIRVMVNEERATPQDAAPSDNAINSEPED